MGRDDERSSPEVKRFPFRSLVRVFGFVALAVAVVWVVTATLSDASISHQAAAASQRAASVQAGSPAPDFHLVTLDGKNVSLSDFRGKPLVLNFFASWCDPCKEETPVVKTMADSAAAGGYAVLGVAVQDERASLQQFISDEGLAMPVTMDNGAAHVYGVIGPPTTVFIDATGVVRDIVMGPLTPDRVSQGLNTASTVTGAANSLTPVGGSNAPTGAETSLLATMALALGAGLLSFLSPCVLPLLPAYMGYIGLSTEALAKQDAAPSKLPILFRTGAFVAGLIIVFAALGFSASFIGGWLTDYRSLLARIGGLFVLVFGLHTLGILPIPLLYREYRPALSARQRHFNGGVLSAGVLGAAFAVGWTPCVGPMLGTILLLAGQAGTAGAGVSLLLAYGVGLGLPFFLAGLAFSHALGTINSLKRHMGLIERVSGALLIVMAALLISGNLSAITVWLQHVL